MELIFHQKCHKQPILLLVTRLNRPHPFFKFVSPKMERDSKPPCQQSTLKHDQLKEKEFSVLTKAYLDSYWKDVEFDENHIKIEQTNCGGDSLK